MTKIKYEAVFSRYYNAWCVGIRNNANNTIEIIEVLGRTMQHKAVVRAKAYTDRLRINNPFGRKPE